ncbi:GNAT family N-acetyltransferase [Rhizobium leguminosarum]|uniref:GNAT family N-acetyltransferase n=1 Tax=Rhizobium leguminosarum TaxID=384 RepID=UPI001C96B69F|nr:GNAT family N-acetyltransferase [Rhizobium leguminosarum]MBY5812641.1 GNAT family N-acetyltransferase [Rhizobium leguminosarum]
MNSEPNCYSEFEIRTATEADVAVLGQYGARLILIHHEWDRSRFIAASPRTPAMYATYLKGQLDKSDVLVLVAEAGRVAFGYVYAGVEGPDYMALRGPAGVIYDIYVDDAYRRRGAGRSLLTAAVDELARRGADQVVLSTAYRNEAARRLFAAAGFAPTMIEMTMQIGNVRTT